MNSTLENDRSVSSMTPKAGHTFTAGPWRAKGRTIMNADGVKIATATVHSGGKNFKPDEVAEANAALIAEAGTILHETGLTPRQLAEQRDELLAALERIERGATAVLLDAALSDAPDGFDECPINPGVLEQIAKDARAAIAKATAGGAV